MIDVHCHLTQPDYDSDRGEVIERCRQGLKAVVTSCAHPKDFSSTMQLVEQYPKFIFCTVGIHPTYVKEIGETENNFIDLVEKNREKVNGIGEVGLDFKIQENEFREQQKKLFISFMKLSEKIKLPLIIHSRAAFKEAMELLESYRMKNVLMHFFTARELLNKVIENDWYISVNTTLLTSKKIKKIVRDLPLERILTETDAPWLGLEKERNEPSSVKLVVEKIAQIKKLSFDEADSVTTENAQRFFSLTF
ncbi:MAG: TatD family hydrolase [Candidatus Bathyarchaeota archaeon]